MRRLTKLTLKVTAIFVTLIVVTFFAYQQMVRSTTSFGTIHWQRAIRTSQKALDVGEQVKAERYALTALNQAKDLGKDHPFYTISLRTLSDIYYYQNKFVEAQQYSLAELEILRKLGDNYQDTVPVLLRLADIAIAQGKIADAETHLKEAKTIRDKSLYNQTWKAEIDARFSLIALAKGNRADCDMFRQKAEREWIEAVKEPKTGSNMSVYGEDLVRASANAPKKAAKIMLAMAEYWCSRGLTLIAKSSGYEQLSFTHGCNRLASYYKAVGRPEEELACYKRAAEKALASSVLTTEEKAQILLEQGNKMKDEERWNEALSFYEKQLPLAKSLGRAKEGVYWESVLGLTFCLIRAGRGQESLALKQDLVRFYDRIGDKKSADIHRREIEIISASAR